MKKILATLFAVTSAFVIVFGAGIEPMPNTNSEPTIPIVSTENGDKNKENQEEPNLPNCEDENQLFSDN